MPTQTAIEIAALRNDIRLLQRDLTAKTAKYARLREALEAVMPQLEGCDCIYSDRDALLCPCRTAWAALQGDV